MPQSIVGALLVVHGLITAMIGVGGLTGPNKPALALPSWFDWWPGSFGRSWLVDSLHFGTGGALVVALLWTVAGAALIAAGLGLAGLPVVQEQWMLLAVAGGGLGLVALALSFHPIYIGAVLINAVLLILVWDRLSTAS